MLISRMFAYQASQLLWAASTCGGSLTNPDALSVKRYEVVLCMRSFHRTGAAHPHLPHRVRAPPHLVFGKSSVWVRCSAINGIELAYTVAQSM